MNPKSLLFAGLALAAGAWTVRADDTPATPPANPPPANPANPDGGHGGPRHGGKHGGMYSLGELTKKLSLTADQQTKVGAILKDAREQGKAVKDDTSLSKDDRRNKMRDIAKTAHDQIRALLTADQQKTFDAMPPPGHGPGGPGGPGGQGGQGTQEPPPPTL
jgi:Spy/CpxP family protein refolding chaperone